MGGQKFTALPVALSLTATSISAITMMGSPSEYYVYGSTFAWVALVDVLACLVAALVYIPIYYNLGVTSIYEYLEIRFGPSSRTIMTIGNSSFYISIYSISLKFHYAKEFFTMDSLSMHQHLR